MEQICPLCNGLTEINQSCPGCGIVMEDKGALENFYGPYSPFQDLDTIKMVSLPEEGPPEQCVHLIACPNCGHDKRVSVAPLWF